jgi:hypothetical protein
VSQTIPIDQPVECILSIDGEEFIHLAMTRTEAHRTFNEMLDHDELDNEIGTTEYSLQVFRPQLGGYLRERMVVRSVRA